MDTEPDFLAHRVGRVLPPVHTRPPCARSLLGGAHAGGPAPDPAAVSLRGGRFSSPARSSFIRDLHTEQTCPEARFIFRSGVRLASDDRHESLCPWLCRWCRPSSPISKRNHTSVTVFEAGPGVLQPLWAWTIRRLPSLPRAGVAWTGWLSRGRPPHTALRDLPPSEERGFSPAYFQPRIRDTEVLPLGYHLDSCASFQEDLRSLPLKPKF